MWPTLLLLYHIYLRQVLVGNPAVHFFQLTVVLTSWGHARPDTPVLLLCCQGRIGI